MNSVKFGDETVYPSKVVCIGRNYVEHIKELGNEIPENMVIFNKPNSAISGKLAYFDDLTRFEGEICLLIMGGDIAGLGFGLDLTHAGIQNRLKGKGLPWERAKAFDGSAVLSDFVPFDGDMEKVSFELYREWNLVQSAGYDLMIYKPHEILEEIKSFMTLEDGDIVMTGTPKGVDTYRREDRFSARLVYDGDTILKTEWRAL
jgi:2-keto-4-pentenoate hydratase/2-oxohepta-3-ene-1,7-dioic acid hydratase in catechol pathway